MTGPGFRQLGVALLSIALLCALPMLPATSPATLATRPVSAGPWLDRLNTWRSSTGLSTVDENTTWSAGDYNHGQYMVMNDLVTHYETPGTPYYTTAGDTEAQKSNIYVSSSTSTTDTQAIDWWMGAPFHAMAMMDPRLTTVGFGSFRYSKSGWDMGAALDVIQGNPFGGGAFPVFFPGNGSVEPLTSYSGNEFPDPLQACSGYSMPTGLPIFVETGGNINTTVGPVHTLTGNGVSLANCVIDSNNSAVGSYLYARGGVIMIPQAPLQNGVKYTVALTVNGVPYTWSFTVGAFTTSPCTSVSLTPSVASPQNPGASITFTAAAAGCPMPEYLWYVQDPSGAWTRMTGYGGPTWTWNTSAYLSGNYVVNVWARDANSGVNVQVNKLLPFTLGSGCGVSLTADKASPQQIGTQVTFTASANGCGNPEYLFYLLSPSGAWTLMRGYGGATWTWNTAGMASIGNYVVNVWVRPVGSSVSVEANHLLPYSLIVMPCTAATLSSNLSSPQRHGAVITFTAGSSGCAMPQYLFYLKGPGLYGTWSVVPGYGGATWTWSTAGVASVGTYEVNVWVREAGSGVPVQTNAVLYYTLT